MSIFRVTVVLYFIKILQKCNIIHDFKNGGCMIKRGGLTYFLFLYPKRGLNIEITVLLFLPLPSQTCCRRGGNCRG
jgi:hypothetical protein